LSLAGLIVLGAGCASAPPARAPGGPPEQKLATILRLEDRRILREAPPPLPPPAAAPRKGKPAPAPPADLRQLLSDSEPRIRYRAALAIGRVGLADGVPPLTAALADADADVRRIAAFALGLVGDRAAVPALTKALADADWLVRGRAAEALGLIGDPAGAAAVGTLAREAASAGSVAEVPPDDERIEMPPAAEAFRLAIYALVRLKAFEPLAAALLDAGGHPIGRWWPTAYALQRVLVESADHRADPRAGAALLELARGPGRYTVAFAMRGLGLVKPPGAIDAILPYADASRLDPIVAPAAVRALGQIGGEPAAAALARILSAPAADPGVRVEAVSALGAMRAASAREILLDQIADRWPSLRAAALGAVARIDPEGFLMILSGLDPDPHWSVRAAVAEGLATLAAEQALPRLESMVDDSDRRVVPAVLTALARLDAPSLPAILLAHLDDPDVVVRMTAARLIGEKKIDGGVEALARAYVSWGSDTTYLARAAALGALAASGGPRAIETLKTALGDREWAVRLRALELLRSLGAAAPPEAIRPVPDSPPPQPYDSPDLVSPPFSPHLYLETAKGTIEIELAIHDAPITAQHLVALARKEFFSGLPFHRVVPTFVVQGGDPRGDGEGGPGFTIRDELTPQPYLRGTVGIALDWEDTGGSQFFITHSPQPHLDGRYAVVGRVVSGMEVVDRIQQWDAIERVRVWDGVRLTP
jgi:cyclophilin family peptidyl-prolyl cis-trans isomerase